MDLSSLSSSYRVKLSKQLEYHRNEIVKIQELLDRETDLEQLHSNSLNDGDSKYNTSNYLNNNKPDNNTILSKSFSRHAPCSSLCSTSSSSSSLYSSLLDEPWATAIIADPSYSFPPPLSWLTNWQYPWIRPPVAQNDNERSAVASDFFDPNEPEEEIFDKLCQIARKVFDVQFAGVAIVEQDEVYFKSCNGVHPPMIGIKGAPRRMSLCNWVMAKKGTMVVPDLKSDPAFVENPLGNNITARRKKNLSTVYLYEYYIIIIIVNRCFCFCFLLLLVFIPH